MFSDRLNAKPSATRKPQAPSGFQAAESARIPVKQNAQSVTAGARMETLIGGVEKRLPDPRESYGLQPFGLVKRNKCQKPNAEPLSNGQNQTSQVTKSKLNGTGAVFGTFVSGNKSKQSESLANTTVYTAPRPPPVFLKGNFGQHVQQPNTTDKSGQNRNLLQTTTQNGDSVQHFGQRIASIRQANSSISATNKSTSGKEFEDHATPALQILQESPATREVVNPKLDHGEDEQGFHTFERWNEQDIPEGCKGAVELLHEIDKLKLGKQDRPFIYAVPGHADDQYCTLFSLKTISSVQEIPENSDYFTISEDGALLLTEDRQQRSFIPLDAFERQLEMFTQCRRIPFFRTFKKKKPMMMWKYKVRRANFERRSVELDRALIICKPHLQKVLKRAIADGFNMISSCPKLSAAVTALPEAFLEEVSVTSNGISKLIERSLGRWITDLLAAVKIDLADIDGNFQDDLKFTKESEKRRRCHSLARFVKLLDLLFLRFRCEAAQVVADNVAKRVHESQGVPCVAIRADGSIFETSSLQQNNKHPSTTFLTDEILDAGNTVATNLSIEQRLAEVKVPVLLLNCEGDSPQSPIKIVPDETHVLDRVRDGIQKLSRACDNVSCMLLNDKVKKVLMLEEGMDPTMQHRKSDALSIATVWSTAGDSLQQIQDSSMSLVQQDLIDAANSVSILQYPQSCVVDSISFDMQSFKDLFSIENAEFEIDEIEKQLNRCQANFDALVQCPEEFRGGSIMISARKLRASWLPLPTRVREEAYEFVSNFMARFCAAVVSEVSGLSSGLQHRPDEVHEFIDLCEFIIHATNNITRLEERSDAVQELLIVIQDQHIDIKMEDKVTVNSLPSLMAACRQNISQANNFKDAAIAPMIKKLDKQVTELNHELSSVQDRLSSDTFVEYSETHDAILDDLSSVNSIVEKLQVRAATLRHYQSKIGGKNSSTVGDIESVVMSTSSLLVIWSALRDVRETEDEYLKKKVAFVNTKQIVSKLSQCEISIKSVLVPELAQGPLAKQTTKLLRSLKDLIPVIDALTCKELRVRHWQRIDDIFGKPVDKGNSITVEQLKSCGAVEFADRLMRVADIARAEFACEEHLHKLQSAWTSTEINLDASENLGSGAYVLSDCESLNMFLEDGLITMRRLIESDASEYVRPDLIKLMDEYTRISSLLSIWRSTESVWLEASILFSPEVQKQLKPVFSTFTQHERHYRRLVTRVHERPALPRVSAITGLKDSFERIFNSLLDVIDPLHSFLDEKCIAYPKLLLLPVHESRRILSVASAAEINPYVGKLLSGATSLVAELDERLEGKEAICGVRSARFLFNVEGTDGLENAEVEIGTSRKVTVRGTADHWMESLEVTLSETIFVALAESQKLSNRLKAQAKRSSTTATKMNAGMFMRQNVVDPYFSSHTIPQVADIFAYEQCQCMLSDAISRNGKDDIAEVSNMFLKAVDVVQTQIVKSQASPVAGLRLLSILLSWHMICSHLMKLADCGPACCEWLMMPKYRSFFSASGDLQSLSLEFGCHAVQYGCQALLDPVAVFLLPSHPRTLFSILSAYHENCAAEVVSLSSMHVGKATAIRYAAQLAGRMFVEISLNPETTAESASRNAIGASASPCFVAFRQVGLIQSQVLSEIAQWISKLLAATRSKSDTITTSIGTVHVPSVNNIFFTKATTCSLHDPTQRSLSLRSVWIQQPDFSLVLKLALTANGMRSAADLATRLANVFLPLSKLLGPWVQSLAFVLVITRLHSKISVHCRDSVEKACMKHKLPVDFAMAAIAVKIHSEHANARVSPVVDHILLREGLLVPELLDLFDWSTIARMQPKPIRTENMVGSQPSLSSVSRPMQVTTHSMATSAKSASQRSLAVPTPENALGILPNQVADLYPSRASLASAIASLNMSAISRHLKSCMLQLRDAMCLNRPIFLSGAAGTGKTLALKKLVSVINSEQLSSIEYIRTGKLPTNHHLSNLIVQLFSFDLASSGIASSSKILSQAIMAANNKSDFGIESQLHFSNTPTHVLEYLMQVYIPQSSLITSQAASSYMASGSWNINSGRVTTNQNVVVVFEGRDQASHMSPSLLTKMSLVTVSPDIGGAVVIDADSGFVRHESILWEFQEWTKSWNLTDISESLSSAFETCIQDNVVPAVQTLLHATANEAGFSKVTTIISNICMLAESLILCGPGKKYLRPELHKAKYQPMSDLKMPVKIRRARELSQLRKQLAEMPEVDWAEYVRSLMALSTAQSFAFCCSGKSGTSSSSWQAVVDQNVRDSFRNIKFPAQHEFIQHCFLDGSSHPFLKSWDSFAASSPSGQELTECSAYHKEPFVPSSRLIGMFDVVDRLMHMPHRNSLLFLCAPESSGKSALVRHYSMKRKMSKLSQTNEDVPFISVECGCPDWPQTLATLIADNSSTSLWNGEVRPSGGMRFLIVFDDVSIGTTNSSLPDRSQNSMIQSNLQWMSSLVSLGCLANPQVSLDEDAGLLETQENKLVWKKVSANILVSVSSANSSIPLDIIRQDTACVNAGGALSTSELRSIFTPVVKASMQRIFALQAEAEHIQQSSGNGGSIDLLAVPITNLCVALADSEEYKFAIAPQSATAFLLRTIENIGNVVEISRGTMTSKETTDRFLSDCIIRVMQCSPKLLRGAMDAIAKACKHALGTQLRIGTLSMGGPAFVPSVPEMESSENSENPAHSSSQKCLLQPKPFLDQSDVVSHYVGAAEVWYQQMAGKPLALSTSSCMSVHCMVRMLETPGQHILLSGQEGSGRKSLISFACWLMQVTMEDFTLHSVDNAQSDFDSLLLELAKLAVGSDGSVCCVIPCSILAEQFRAYRLMKLLQGNLSASLAPDDLSNLEEILEDNFGAEVALGNSSALDWASDCMMNVLKIAVSVDPTSKQDEEVLNSWPKTLLSMMAPMHIDNDIRAATAPQDESTANAGKEDAYQSLNSSALFTELKSSLQKYELLMKNSLNQLEEVENSQQFSSESQLQQSYMEKLEQAKQISSSAQNVWNEIYAEGQDIAERYSGCIKSCWAACVPLIAGDFTIKQRLKMQPSNAHFHILQIAVIRRFSGVVQELVHEAFGLLNGLIQVLKSYGVSQGMLNKLTVLKVELDEEKAAAAHALEMANLDRKSTDILAASLEREQNLSAEYRQKAKDFQKEAELKLKEALPDLEGALQLIKKIERSDINELKVSRYPPKAARLCVSWLCRLFGIEDDWEAGGRKLLDSRLAVTLEEMDKDNIPDDLLAELVDITEDPDMDPKAVERVSSAALSLTKWIHAIKDYALIERKIRPTRQSLARAVQKAKDTEAKIQKTEEKLKEAKQQLKVLEEESNLHQERVKEMEDKMVELNSTISLSQKLQHDLKDDFQRWCEQAKSSVKNVATAFSSCMVEQFLIILGGGLSQATRQGVSQTLLSTLFASGFGVDFEFKYTNFALKREDILSWQASGLPVTEKLLGSLTTTFNCEQPVIVLDPLQIIQDYIRCNFNDDQVLFLEPDSNGFDHSLARCIRGGKRIAVNCTGMSAIGGLLRAVIENKTYENPKTGQKVLATGPGQPDIEWNSSFRCSVIVNSRELEWDKSLISAVMSRSVAADLSPDLELLVNFFMNSSLKVVDPEILEAQIQSSKDLRTCLSRLHQEQSHLINHLDGMEASADKLTTDSITSIFNTIKAVNDANEAMARSSAIKDSAENAMEILLPVASSTAKAVWSAIKAGDTTELNFSLNIAFLRNLFSHSIELFKPESSPSQDSKPTRKSEVSEEKTAASPIRRLSSMSLSSSPTQSPRKQLHSEDTDSDETHLDAANAFSASSRNLSAKSTRQWLINASENLAKAALKVACSALPGEQRMIAALLYSLEVWSEGDVTSTGIFMQCIENEINAQSLRAVQIMLDIRKRNPASFALWAKGHGHLFDIFDSSVKDNIDAAEFVIGCKWYSPSRFRQSIRSFITDALGEEFADISAMSMARAVEISNICNPVIFVSSQQVSVDLSLKSIGYQATRTVEVVSAYTLPESTDSTLERIKQLLEEGKWILIYSCQQRLDVMQSLSKFCRQQQSNMTVSPYGKLFLEFDHLSHSPPLLRSVCLSVDLSPQLTIRSQMQMLVNMDFFHSFTEPAAQSPRSSSNSASATPLHIVSEIVLANPTQSPEGSPTIDTKSKLKLSRAAASINALLSLKTARPVSNQGSKSSTIPIQSMLSVRLLRCLALWHTQICAREEVDSSAWASSNKPLVTANNLFESASLLQVCIQCVMTSIDSQDKEFEDSQAKMEYALVSILPLLKCHVLYGIYFGCFENAIDFNAACHAFDAMFHTQTLNLGGWHADPNVSEVYPLPAIDSWRGSDMLKSIRSFPPYDTFRAVLCDPCFIPNKNEELRFQNLIELLFEAENRTLVLPRMAGTASQNAPEMTEGESTDATAASQQTTEEIDHNIARTALNQLGVMAEQISNHLNCEHPSFSKNYVDTLSKIDIAVDNLLGKGSASADSKPAASSSKHRTSSTTSSLTKSNRQKATVPDSKQVDASMVEGDKRQICLVWCTQGALLIESTSFWEFILSTQPALKTWLYNLKTIHCHASDSAAQFLQIPIPILLALEFFGLQWSADTSEVDEIQTKFRQESRTKFSSAILNAWKLCNFVLNRFEYFSNIFLRVSEEAHLVALDARYVDARMALASLEQSAQMASVLSDMIQSCKNGQDGRSLAIHALCNDYRPGVEFRIAVPEELSALPPQGSLYLAGLRARNWVWDRRHKCLALTPALDDKLGMWLQYQHAESTESNEMLVGNTLPTSIVSARVLSSLETRQRAFAPPAASELRSTVTYEKHTIGSRYQRTKALLPAMDGHGQQVLNGFQFRLGSANSTADLQASCALILL